MTEIEEKKTIAEEGGGGEEKEEESDEEHIEEEEQEDGDEEEDEGDENVQLVRVKQRRCQRRKKIRQIIINSDDEDEGEDLELFLDGEDEEDEGEDEESEVSSYTSSVLSAISFVWENEVYEFEELCDHEKIEWIYRKQYVDPDVFDDLGVARYLDVCKALNISPMIRVLESLNTEEIDLSYRNVDSPGIRALCAALETNRIVKKLILRYNRLKVDDCYYIGLILEYNESLSYLDFTGCRVGPEGLALLTECLPKNEYVVDLILSKCNIKDEGMKVLANVLLRNNSIQKLDLSYNKLEEESAEWLALAFKMNTCVTHLILRYNNLFQPTTMKGFFRSLTFNTSITYLDLSWNGMSGQDMGSLIKNYLRRSSSIQYLDLSDNRFEGLAVLEIKRGLAKSRTLETLRMGKNPMSPADVESILSGANGSYNLKVLDLDDLWVKKSFIKNLKKIQAQREIDVNFAGILANYEVFGPDYPKVILERAQFEALKPKKKKARRDFGHLMWTLGDEPITEKEFMTRVKKFKAKINKELFPELIKQFLIPKVNLIDVAAMRNKYLSLFPDSTPPPPPKVKGKKGKKGKKGEEEVPAAQPEEGKEKPAEVAPVEGKEGKGTEVIQGGEGEGLEDEEEGDLVIGDFEEGEEELGIGETEAVAETNEEAEEEEVEEEKEPANNEDNT